jgi:hypothetical protein
MEKIEEFKRRLEELDSSLTQNENFDEKKLYQLKSMMLMYKWNNPEDTRVDTLIDMVDSISDAYINQENKKLNHRLNLLTIWSTIFLPLSFYTGMWGMNFDDIPLLNGDNGFWIFAGLTAITILIMFTYFKRHKWF